jgi:hypothetical protein
MNTATTPAVSKTYIAEWIKLDFFNNSNLKTDIQNRISDNIEVVFINALNNLKGDNKNNSGIPFSEITLLAMAYFYSEIFTDEIKNEYYTLEMVKGFLDANNLTPYTAIHEIDVVFCTMKDVPYFKHCWLIIQSAWFFNSQYFGHHQHIDYVNHYINTSEKLPIDNYKFDQNYLEKKYNDIDSRKKKRIPINGFTLVNQWYYGILFLVCSELKLPAKNFKNSIKDDREYNPLVKTSRQLRPLAPFKIIECDIKSAFPTFLDIEAGATLKDQVYNNLMKSKGIKRGEAKVLFNTICNSGKYKSKQETTAFFIECGYTPQQCEKLISLTHNSNRKFIFSMTEYEALAINHFVSINNLQQSARLHDAVIFIDDKTKPQILHVPPNCDFGIKELNRPKVKESFAVGKKRLKFAYVNSIPKGLNLISKVEYKKPEIKGIANGFIFYSGKFEYHSASFNLNDYPADYSRFTGNCTVMFSTLLTLNNKPLKPFERLLILQHIRQNSNYIFNVRALYSKYKIVNPSYLISKSRDWNFTENMTFKKNIDFITARSEAEKLVNIQHNYKDLFDLLEERISNNDFSYIYELSFKGRKDLNKLSFAIVQYYNLICTGHNRKQRKQVSSNTLYNSSIKDVTVKSLSLPKQRQNAFVQKKIKVYERALKGFNRLVNNRPKAKQMLFILIDITGFKTDIRLNRNEFLMNEIKTELLNIIDKEDKTNRANEFNELYPKLSTQQIPIINDLNTIFDTDIQNSIFNQIDIQQAHERGALFFQEYLKFHGIDEVSETLISTEKLKEKYKLPEINFD